ncbi:hypothetical protein N7468_009138 [Penicillium chermesinum]|uniref:Fumarylacetoacetate hydrolase n=1 Tax=Penicillium chermesinum TaxID=63820 RepID=A0A9W9TEZ8_9EURO|nr:uncharacterized protein N7468_009138 [Penicillium chermesinum]KAJ5219934.1 hypothetical protein N7468_009138 [Penicillium chermesinum]
MAPRLVNYLSFREPELGVPRIGHVDWESRTVQPLALASGFPLQTLYQVIAVESAGIKPVGEPLKLDAVEILPPITGRDILAVGKNYAEHAIEFNKSGYDSSDKVDQPSHPVIFTKRATSIVPDGSPIAFNPSFTQTLDYEGELGVIVGKAGRGIKAKDAMDHVWGYTIINDVTARERQRDHKQFFIGKSGDTYCPMGPVAVPASALPEVLTVQTFVNGEKRQEATTQSLIFSIPTLLETISEGMTLQPGDVIATGTPAGVGFGQNPPTYLQPGDEVTVKITGLGSLTNKIADVSFVPSVEAPSDLNLPAINTSKTVTGNTLTTINGKPLYYKSQGAGDKNIALSLDKSYRLHLADLEGHGLSPTSAVSIITIESLASDLEGIFAMTSVTSPDTTIVAHSMGCLVALQFAMQNPNLVKKLILLGPPPNPLPDPAVKAFHDRAALVRKNGMLAIVDAVSSADTSQRTQSSFGPYGVRLSLLATEPESYAKACTALAEFKGLDLGKIHSDTLIVTGDEDRISPPALCAGFAERIPGCQPPVVLRDVGHWHTLEDPQAVANAIRGFL